ncbi:methyl-accepting chemotaxis protein [Evansella caseinilytica]|uniref:Methyl-accepting chemotaxis protein n=1 Tax=Evansella caseinilytica TaxID=1503961 RepID=A0A1H3ULQ5_9BACI|nr:methyl-accepting chemotaxis protein [Evansella caseinilytica]SDZ63360.1 methyl-accepting chemotaxis protein [Evansella caseinilytica]
MNLFKKIPSIRLKLLVVFIPIILISTISISLLNYYESKKVISYVTEQRVNNNLNTLAEQMKHEFTAHTRVAEAVASLYQSQGNTLAKIDYQQFLEEVLLLNENTFGVGMWLEPFAFNDNMNYFGPYVYRDGDTLIHTEEYETPSYDYPSTDWYLLGKATTPGQAAWTDPYYDETLGISMITAALPLIVDDQFVGVVTADYDLSTIQSIISDETFEASGYFFLVGQNGQFIAHRDESRVLNEVITDDKAFQELGNDLFVNEQGMKQVVDENETWESYFTTFPDTDWKLVAIAPAKEIYGAVQSLFQKGLIIASAFIAFSILIIFLFSSTITKQIKQLVEHIQRLAHGDLTQTIDVQTKDEIGDIGHHYNASVEKLKDMLQAIHTTSTNVASSSEQLSASSEETSKSVLEVASSIEEVAANNRDQSTLTESLSSSTNNITDSIQAIATNVEEVKNNAFHTSDLAKEGNQNVNEVMKQMELIHSQVMQLSASTQQLNAKSKEIEEILSLITSIAEQTNLLALNAAIEAARAGDNGKGFAVVADEVRKLAEQSGNASGKIRDLIQDIQSDISDSVQMMNSSQDTTHAGIQVVEKTGQSFRSIYDSISDVTAQTENAYKSVTQILQETKQVKERVESVRKIAVTNDDNAQSVSAATEQQSAIMEEISAASDELSRLATELQDEMQKFQI